jgi:GNAT superfamily N-acetyltransferase
MIPPERVAAAEYGKRRVLATTTETRFGTFVHDAAHEHRAAATQLVEARLPSRDATLANDTGGEGDAAVDALLERVETLYDQHGLDHRVVSGVDRETFARLEPVLRERGYERERYCALIPQMLDDATYGPSELRIEATRHGSDDAQLVHEAVGRDPEGVTYAAEVARTLDGTELVAVLGDDPVGVAGWYVHGEGDDAVARFTHVGVHPEVQGRGVGSTLVAAVVARCPVPPGRQVVCATPADAGFYERLGFTRNTHLWRFARLP